MRRRFSPIERQVEPYMAHALKPEELQSFERMLTELRARLRGDLNQMSDEALGRMHAESSGNLSNIPADPADIGTEIYDQEFTLNLIQNEQETLDQIEEALERLRLGTYGLCTLCSGPIAKPRLQAIPYTRACIGCARQMEREAGA